MHHGNHFGRVHHDAHIVLDENDGLVAVALDLLDDGNELGNLFRRHPSCRFIEQQYLRILREDHSQFEFALIAVRQVARESQRAFVQPNLVNDLPRFPFVRLEIAGAIQHLEIVMSQGLACEADIFKRRETWENVGNLKRASDAEVRDSLHGGVRNLDPLEKHVTARRIECAAEQIEQRRFTRAVGTDNRMKCARVNSKIHVVDSHQAAEFLAQLAPF